MELALIAPVMVLLTLGVVDLARAYRLDIQVENAAREGAAFAQTQPNDVECATFVDVRDRVLAEEQGLASRPGFLLEVHGQDDDGDWTPVTGCGGNVVSVGERVRVTVTLRFDVLTPLVGSIVGESIDISRSAEVRAQR